MAGRPKMPEADRFMSHVAHDASGCWLWTAFCMKSAALQIRRSTRPQAELANQFGVSQTAISNIRTGTRWAHLQQ